MEDRSPLPPTPPEVGLTLLAAVLVSFVGLGGVLPAFAAATHGVLAVALVLVAVRTPTIRLERAGAALDVSTATAVLLVPLAVTLVPLPAVVRGLIAPGHAAAFPGRSWSPVALDVEATIGAACLLVLVGGFAVGLVPATVGRRARATAGTWIPIGALVVVLVTLGHAISGADAAFGVVPVVSGAGRMYLPLVDPNHLAALLTAALPFLIERLAAGRPLRAFGAGVRIEDLPPVLATAGVVCVLVALRSAAGLAVGAAVGVVMALRSAWPGRRLLAVGVGVAGLVAAVGALIEQPGSVTGRLAHWLDGLRAAPSFLLLGAGPGAWPSAVGPFRTDLQPLSYAHAHNEPLERLVETGLVGLPAVALAVWLLRPRTPTDDPRAAALTGGLLVLLVHSLIEFPTRIPVLLLIGAVLWAYRRGFDATPRVGAGRVRAVLVVLALTQAAGGAWRFREAVADQAARAVVATRGSDDGAARRLTATAPWRGEAAMIPVWRLSAAGDGPAVIDAARVAATQHSDDARVLVAAGEALARFEEVGEAEAAFVRATERAPFDPRPRVALARFLGAQGRSEEAGLAWQQAFLRDCGVGYLDEAWRSMPDPVVWASRLEGARGVYAATLAARVGADPAGALVLWDTAAGAAPEAYGVAAGRIRAMVAVGLVEQAFVAVQGALADRPGDPVLLELLGDVHFAAGQHDDAAEAWLQAGTRRPAAFVRAVRALADAGRPDDALQVARRARLAGASDPALVVETAQILADTGQVVACRELLDHTRFTGAEALRERAEALRARCRGGG